MPDTYVSHGGTEDTENIFLEADSSHTVYNTTLSNCDVTFGPTVTI
jgi:hypothetical protein